MVGSATRVSLSESVFPAVPLAIDPVFVGSDLIQCMDIITGETPLGNMIPYGAPPFDHEFDIEALQEAYNPGKR